MTTPVSLHSALVVRRALESTVLPAVDPSIRVEPSFDPTTVLAQRIRAGERPDVLIAVTSALAPILATGAVAESTMLPFVRSGIGLAVAAGADRPPLESVDDLVAALVGARSVAYSKAGASGIYFVRLLEQLGIADQVNSRATALEKGFTAEAVADGRADLAVQQVSELRFVDRVDVIGFLPEPVQQYTDFTLALGVGAAERPDAVALQQFLLGPLAARAYRADGLELLPR